MGTNLPWEAAPPLPTQTPLAAAGRSGKGSGKPQAAPRRVTATITVANVCSRVLPRPGSHPGEVKICHRRGSGIGGRLPHLRVPNEAEV